MEPKRHTNLLAQVVRLENLSFMEQFAVWHQNALLAVTRYQIVKTQPRRHSKLWQRLLKLGLTVAAIFTALVLLGWVAVEL